jgi:hypothetical protein
MPYGRNMNDAVLLPNGQIIIVNGAKVRCEACLYGRWLHHCSNEQVVHDMATVQG